MSRPRIGFAGLSHLGTVSAAAAAAQGFDVVAYDADPVRVEGIATARPAIHEPGLTEMLAAHQSRVEATQDITRLSTCDVVYVAEDVPTDGLGVSDLQPILALVERVVAILGPEAVLVILNQVPPGFTRAVALESHRRFYQVETLVFGRAVERATKPERFILGCADPLRPLPPVLDLFLRSFGCPLLPMRYESAELAKTAINLCLVAHVTIANSLGDLAERIGADWMEIVPALRLDARIGPQAYLRPGLGLAGGNLERDLTTITTLGTTVGADVQIVQAMIQDSRYRRDWVLRSLHDRVLAIKPAARIAVLGLAYKENTASIKNSASLELIEALSPEVRIAVHDPVVELSGDLAERVSQTDDLEDACAGADVLVVMTPWPDYRTLDAAMLKSALNGRLIIDPYRVFDPATLDAAGLEHLTLGRGHCLPTGESAC